MDWLGQRWKPAVELQPHARYIKDLSYGKPCGEFLFRKTSHSANIARNAFALRTPCGFSSHLAQEAAESLFSKGPRKRPPSFLVLTTLRYVPSACSPGPRSLHTKHTHRSGGPSVPLAAPCSSCTESPMQLLARLLVLGRTAPYLPQARRRSAGPATPLPPLSSFRQGACYRVIALLINVSPSRDNSVIFTVRFFRLAMRDRQWCNLLSVYYALLGTPAETV